MDISFDDFRERVAARMGVEPAEASIAFRFRHDSNIVSQSTKARYEELQTEAKFRQVIGNLVKKVCNARTRAVFLELKNMVSSV